MKKTFKVLLAVVLVLTQLVGCTSPMAKYQKDIKAQNIQGKMNEIDVKADEAFKAFESLLQGYEMASSIEDIEGYQEADTLIKEYRTLVADTIQEVNDIDSKNKDISSVHRLLVGGLIQYETLGNTMGDILTFATELFLVMDDMSVVNGSLMTLGMPSDSYNAAFTQLVTDNEEAVNALSNLDLENMLLTGDIDETKVESAKASVNLLVEGFKTLPTSTDLDVQYSDTVVRLYTGIVDILGILLEYKELVPLMNTKETLDDYYSGVTQLADATINGWKEKISE